MRTDYPGAGIMSRGVKLLIRVALVSALLLVLYLCTSPGEYDLAKSVNDKLSHAVAFLILSLLADFSFPETGFSRVKIAPLLAYGILIECIQYFLPYRSFSLLDIVADIGGILAYLLILPQLRVLRRQEDRS